MLDRGDNLPLTHDRDQPPDLAFALKVEGAYLGLIQAVSAGRSSNQEPSLGGKLLYIPELDEDGRALAVAGNVAGAATLAASANPAVQKQAVRDGVVDFLVTSLDEALRILKNEIRKRETVAVCVAASPKAVEEQMLERGVLPDLLRPRTSSAMDLSGLPLKEESRTVEPDPMKIPALVTWSVATEPAQWLPKLDAIALDCLEQDAWAARRWLRVGPRYLGRLAHGVRLLHADREFGARFIEQVRSRVECSEIGVPVSIQATCRGGVEEHHFSPPRCSQNAP
jgi:hypothetical protein